MAELGRRLHGKREILGSTFGRGVFCNIIKLDKGKKRAFLIYVMQIQHLI